MVRFRTRLVAATCAVAMVGSFWGSAGITWAASTDEPYAEIAQSIGLDPLVFDPRLRDRNRDFLFRPEDLYGDCL